MTNLCYCSPFMSNYKSLALFLSIFIGHQTLGQGDYRTGFAITAAMDTLYGTINYLGSTSHSKKCVFKDDQGNKNEYHPGEIFGYRFIEGKYYVSRDISSDGAKEIVFLEFLIDGTVDVFYLKNQNGESYYLDDGSGLTLLKNEVKHLYIDGKKYSRESKEYIGMLKMAFDDNQEIINKTNNVSLSHNSLIKIAHDYHMAQCPDQQCLIYEKKPARTRFKWGLLALGTASSLRHQTGKYSTEEYYLSHADFNTNISFSGGLFMNINAPLISERISVQCETSFDYKNYESSYTYNDLGETRQSYEEQIEYSYKSINSTIFLEYRVPKKYFFPRFYLGMFFNKHFNEKYFRNQDVYHSSGAHYFSQSTEYNPFTNFDYGVASGIGVPMKISPKHEFIWNLRYYKGFAYTTFMTSNTLQLAISLQL